MLLIGAFSVDWLFNSSVDGRNEIGIAVAKTNKTRYSSVYLALALATAALLVLGTTDISTASVWAGGAGVFVTGLFGGVILSCTQSLPIIPNFRLTKIDTGRSFRYVNAAALYRYCFSLLRLRKYYRLPPTPTLANSLASLRYVNRTHCPCVVQCASCSPMHTRDQLFILFLEDEQGFFELLRGEKHDDE